MTAGTQTFDLSGSPAAAVPAEPALPRPAAAGALPAMRPTRSPWPARLAWLFLAAIGIVIALALLANLFVAAAPSPLLVHIDRDSFGWSWSAADELAQLEPAHKLMLAVVALLALLAALVIVPLLVAFVVVAVALALLLALGIPLLVVLLIGAVVLAPLWLLGWLVWKLVAG